MPTNMDNKGNPNATTTQLEFTLPRYEIDGDFDASDIGELTIPVEVTEIGIDTITFRKRGQVSRSQFSSASVDVLENHVIDKFGDVQR